jgi:hypothetical protein
LSTRLVRQTERGVSRPHDSALSWAIHNRRPVARNAHQRLHEDRYSRACVAGLFSCGAWRLSAVGRTRPRCGRHTRGSQEYGGPGPAILLDDVVVEGSARFKPVHCHGCGPLFSHTQPTLNFAPKHEMTAQNPHCIPSHAPSTALAVGGACTTRSRS